MNARKRGRRRLARRLPRLRRRSPSASVGAGAGLGAWVATQHGAPSGNRRQGLRETAPVARIASWPPSRWLAATGTALAVALVTGLPTDVVPNPFYVRMTPVVWWDYPIWAATAILAGLVAATYVRAGPTANDRRPAGTAFGGSLLSFFAVGCPVCNKLVVAALGAGGALSYFGPAQPAIGLASIGLLATALALRARALAGCSVRPASPSPGDSETVS